jgi:hypothetical protein
MQRMLKWGLVLAFCLASTVMAAEKRTEFSADMLIIQTTGQTLIEKLYVGKGGVQSGYELQKIEVGPQPSELLDVSIGYRQFTFNRLFDLLTKLGQW